MLSLFYPFNLTVTLNYINHNDLLLKINYKDLLLPFFCLGSALVAVC